MTVEIKQVKKLLEGKPKEFMDTLKTTLTEIKKEKLKALQEGYLDDEGETPAQQDMIDVAVNDDWEDDEEDLDWVNEASPNAIERLQIQQKEARDELRKLKDSNSNEPRQKELLKKIKNLSRALGFRNK